MITKLTITNVQAFECLEITLHPLLNVIIGPTNSGKSTIVRCLQQLFYNDLSLKTLLRDGKKWYRIEAETESSCVVREQGKRNRSDFNRYIVKPKVAGLPVQDDSPLSLKFDNIHRSVPPEVRSALGISDLFMNERPLRLNICRQRDIMFLLEASAADFGRLLGLLSDGGLADRLIASYNLDLVRARRQVIEATERQDTLRVQLDNMDWIEESQKRCSEIKEMFRRLNISQKYLSSGTALLLKYRELLRDQISITVEMDTLDKKLALEVPLKNSVTEISTLNTSVPLLAEMSSLLDNQRKLSNRLSSLKDIEVALATLNEYQPRIEALSVLRSTSERLYTLNSEHEALQEEYSHIPDTVRSEEFLSRMEKDQSLTNMDRGKGLLRKLLETLQEHSALEQRVNSTDSTLAESTREFNGLVASGAVCPTCLRPFDQEEAI